MTNNRTMLLLLLSASICAVVVLNMSYLPHIVTTTMEYTSSIEQSIFANSEKPSRDSNNHDIPMDKVKEWGESRSKAKREKKSGPTDSSSLEGDHHKIAGLSCDRFGGPSEEIAAEMVYWRDIPRDAKYESPYAQYGPPKKYLTFEPDEGGWNNIRMSMETATTLAHAMGRTLVLPPGMSYFLKQSVLC